MNYCPHCQSADRYFNHQVAVSDLREYQRRGAGGTTKQLLEALNEAGVAGMSLLDIGGGIGVIQHELSAAGVRPITNVDASNAFLRMARQEAEKRGYAADARYLHGDFVSLAEGIEASHIVTLDRVLCCYPHMEALVDSAAAKTKRLLGLVYPRDTWWTKMGIQVLNGYCRLQRNSFRNFIHPTAAVEQIVGEHGLRKIVHQNGLIWQVAVFAR